MPWTHPDHEASAKEAIQRGVISGDPDHLADVPEPTQSSEHQARVSSLSILNELGGPTEVVDVPWTAGEYPPGEPPVEPPDPPVEPPVDPPVPPIDPPTNTVIIPAGIHNRYTQEVKADTLYLGEPGAILDGGNQVTSAFTGAKDKVVVQGVEIRNYDNPVQVGAIHLMGGKGVQVLDCHVHHNRGVGVKLRFVENGLIARNNIHHQHQLGISMEGHNNIVEDNEIAYNNWLKEVSWGFEAGGTKFWKNNNLIVRRNFSHHNHGPGLWDDKDNINVDYYDNIVEDNYANGIFREIGGPGKIYNNHIRRNGPGQGNWLWGGGILIATTHDVEVYDNLLEDNFNGLTLTIQNRGSGAYGQHHGLDNVFHDNQVIRSGNSGVVRDTGDNTVYDRTEFYGNTYQNEKSFAWLNRWGDLSWWQGYHPNDG